MWYVCIGSKSLKFIINKNNSRSIIRGFSTFSLRMKAHTENALAVTNSFKNHVEVTQVIYLAFECYA
ncbi:MAG: PLP-dependent transferase [Prolixibacteraceae bacterium]|nr:PLP-dependent transferase [Prolixibacteraceae bacterium]